MPCSVEKNAEKKKGKTATGCVCWFSLCNHENKGVKIRKSGAIAKSSDAMWTKNPNTVAVLRTGTAAGKCATPGAIGTTACFSVLAKEDPATAGEWHGFYLWYIPPRYGGRKKKHNTKTAER